MDNSASSDKQLKLLEDNYVDALHRLNKAKKALDGYKKQLGLPVKKRRRLGYRYWVRKVFDKQPGPFSADELYDMTYNLWLEYGETYTPRQANISLGGLVSEKVLKFEKGYYSRGDNYYADPGTIREPRRKPKD